MSFLLSFATSSLSLQVYRTVRTSTDRREQGQGNPIAYLSSAEVEAHNWQDVMRMVADYDPTFELVAILLKDKRESVYRIQIPSAKR